MAEIKSFHKAKSKKFGEQVQEFAEKAFPEIKYEQAAKQNDGFYRLAMKINKMQEDDTFDWYLYDGENNLPIGVKLIHEFDAYMVIMSGYGGGFEFIMWLDDDEHGVEEIYEKVKECYQDFKFAGFTDPTVE